MLKRFDRGEADGICPRCKNENITENVLGYLSAVVSFSKDEQISSSFAIENCSRPRCLLRTYRAENLLLSLVKKFC